MGRGGLEPPTLGLRVAHLQGFSSIRGHPSSLRSPLIGSNLRSSGHGSGHDDEARPALASRCPSRLQESAPVRRAQRATPAETSGWRRPQGFIWVWAYRRHRRLAGQDHPRASAPRARRGGRHSCAGCLDHLPYRRTAAARRPDRRLAAPDWAPNLGVGNHTPSSKPPIESAHPNPPLRPRRPFQPRVPLRIEKLHKQQRRTGDWIGDGAAVRTGGRARPADMAGASQALRVKGRSLPLLATSNRSHRASHWNQRMPIPANTTM